MEQSSGCLRSLVKLDADRNRYNSAAFFGSVNGVSIHITWSFHSHVVSNKCYVWFAFIHSTAYCKQCASIALPVSPSSLDPYGVFMHMHICICTMSILVILIRFSLRVETSMNASVSFTYFIILMSLQDLKQQDGVLKMYFNAVTRRRQLLLSLRF